MRNLVIQTDHVGDPLRPVEMMAASTMPVVLLMRLIDLHVLSSLLDEEWVGVVSSHTGTNDAGTNHERQCPGLYFE